MYYTNLIDVTKNRFQFLLLLVLNHVTNFKINFRYNKIRSLPNDIFSNMPALEELNLDYNLIHMIQEDTWGLIASQITSLSLEGIFNIFCFFFLCYRINFIQIEGKYKHNIFVVGK